MGGATWHLLNNWGLVLLKSDTNTDLVSQFTVQRFSDQLYHQLYQQENFSIWVRLKCRDCKTKSLSCTDLVNFVINQQINNCHSCTKPSRASFFRRSRWYSFDCTLNRKKGSDHFSIPRYETVTYGKHSMRYLGPRLWTKLPKSIRDVTTLTSFKSKIRQLNISELLDDGCAGCSLCSFWLLYIFTINLLIS